MEQQEGSIEVNVELNGDSVVARVLLTDRVAQLKQQVRELTAVSALQIFKESMLHAIH